MMKDMMDRSTLREIQGSFSRWIAILAIVALGVGFFSGLKVCREAFLHTGDEYLKAHNLYDFELISTLGIEDANVEEVMTVDGIEYAEATRSTDIIYLVEGKNGNSENTGEKVAKLGTVSKKINKLNLISGRRPRGKDEIVVDADRFDDSYIGEKVIFTKSNDKDTLDMLRIKEFTIVGRVKSPLFLNYERGSTSLLDGSVNCFMYVNEEAWKLDYYTEMYVTLSEKAELYSDEYDELISAKEDSIEEAFESAAITRYNDILKEANDKLDDAEKKLAKGRKEIADAERKLADGEAEINSNIKKIRDAKKEIEDNEQKLNEAKEKIEDAEAELDSKAEELEKGKDFMPPEQYEYAKAEIEAGYKEIAKQKKEYEKGIDKIKKAKRDIAKGEEEILKGRKKIEDAKKEVNEGKEKIKKNTKKLKKAKRDVKDIEEPDTYILTREKNIGYVCFDNDINIVEGIAKIFPLFFFLVAALVVMTTMTRMVDEHRTQIGVMKALGFSKTKIMNKYLFYAVSAALIGGLGGFAAGMHVFPYVIWKAYGIMYGFTDLLYVLNIRLGVISIAASLICVIWASFFSFYKEFGEVPAELIRPKAPAHGKRIFLERIKFIWNRMSFLHKVSARNIFRYKKRFFMMVMGISGCTALLVTGFGISDSIKNVVDMQYENVFKANYIVSFEDNPDQEEKADFETDNFRVVRDSLFVYTVSMDATNDGQTRSVNLVAIGDDTLEQLEDRNGDGGLNSFIDLHTEDGEPIDYPGKGECVINTNLAKRLNFKTGDIINLKDSDMNEISAKIVGLSENYVYNYMYINSATYEEQTGKKFEENTAYVLCYSDKDGNETADEIENGEVEYTYESDPILSYSEGGAYLMNADNVSSVSITEDFKDRIGNMMKSLDYVIALIIICAGALAFIVLYNLTNINITERIREIATIKVLGFYPNETAQYVFRENIALTSISAAVGLPLGYALHNFVMNQITVDMISFDIRIEIVSYILAVALTFVFAIIVNFFMLFRLNSINMAESLKSIE